MTGKTETVSFMPDPAKVEAMAGYGLSAVEIAKVMNVDEALLRETCAHELESGHIKANARVAENLYRKATGDGREAVTAAIFWLKTRARWKETTVQEHGVSPDSPITFSVIYEASPPDKAGGCGSASSVSIATGVPRSSN